MDYSERPRPEPKPQFDSAHPETIFTFGAEKQRWLRKRVAQKEQLPIAINHLASDLDQYMVDAFDDSPELTVVSDDVYHTKGLYGPVLKPTIDMERRPRQGDAELFGEHALRGVFFGFHSGEESELRVYIATVDQRPVKRMAGIYQPLFSVGVENSKIELASEASRAELRLLETEILTLTADAQNPELGRNVDSILSVLGSSKVDQAKKLQACGPLIAAVDRAYAPSPKLTDALFEFTKKSLRLDTPQVIKTSRHLDQISAQPFSYKTVDGPTVFEGVVPELGLFSESDARIMAAMFTMNNAAVWIPVHYISIIEQEK